MACTNHPLLTVGVAPCPLCSRPFCDGCLVEMDGRSVCASCKAMTAAAAGGADDSIETTPAVQEGVLPPWERASELGWWAAYWGTVKQVMTGPAAFYGGMEKQTASWTWLGIPAINYGISAIASGLLWVLAFGPLLRWVQTVQPDLAAALEPFAGSVIFMAVSGVITQPVIGVVLAIIWAGSIHLWLHVFKKSRLPFPQTARGVSYAYAPYVLTMVPLLGDLVALIWTSWANVRMVQRMHGTGFLTAFMSVFWLAILIMCCCVGPYVAFVGFAISQGGR